MRIVTCPHCGTEFDCDCLGLGPDEPCLCVVCDRPIPLEKRSGSAPPQ